MSVQVMVVGHTLRYEAATELARQVNGGLSIDNGRLGTYGNHRRALLAGAESGASHVCILEDDAVPVDDFRTHIERVAEIRPNDLVGLYVGRSRPMPAFVADAVRRADEAGASWLHSLHLMWGVGYLVPTRAVPALIEKADARVNTPQADTRIGRAWSASQGRPIYYTWPSLVDHADGPSITDEHERRAPGRVAHRVGVPNWSSKVVDTRT